MDTFVIRAHMRTPHIMRGQSTLDALLMAVLSKGDVSDLLYCVDGLYYASAAITDASAPKQRAAFVASMRPEHTPEWSQVLKPTTKDGDIKIGLSRQRDAGNILNAYEAQSTTCVEWHATGDAVAVLKVLHAIPFIGKKRTAGYGEVERWEVDSSDLDGLAGYANEPLRPIPVDRWQHGGDWIRVEAAWKAPYWDVRNRTECFVYERP